MGGEEETGGEEGVHILGGGAEGELVAVLRDALVPVVGFEEGVGFVGGSGGGCEVAEVGEGGCDDGVHDRGRGEG